MGGFLEYVAGDSFLHRMNPVVKLVCALVLSIACFCSHSPLFLLVIVVLNYGLAAYCSLMKQALGLTKAVVAFSLILAIIQLFTTPMGEVLMVLPWGSIGTGSVLVAVTTIIRLVAAALPLLLVLYVTKLGDISNALVKMMHVPYRYAFTFTSTVHFIPVFMNDMKEIMEAQAARGVEFDSAGLVKKFQLMVPLCVPLLVSSVRKTNSAAIAAEVRGFNLRTSKSGYKTYPLSLRDALALVVCGVFLAVAIITRVWFFL